MHDRICTNFPKSSSTKLTNETKQTNKKVGGGEGRTVNEICLLLYTCVEHHPAVTLCIIKIQELTNGVNQGPELLFRALKSKTGLSSIQMKSNLRRKKSSPPWRVVDHVPRRFLQEEPLGVGANQSAHQAAERKNHRGSLSMLFSPAVG